MGAKEGGMESGGILLACPGLEPRRSAGEGRGCKADFAPSRDTQRHGLTSETKCADHGSDTAGPRDRP